MALDPIGGQGANNGNKMARNLVESIIVRKDLPFDAPWMTETFERFYARFGHITCTFNNILLEPITNAGKMLLIAQYGSDGRARGSTGQQRLADAFIENFNDANGLTPPSSMVTRLTLRSGKIRHEPAGCCGARRTRRRQGSAAPKARPQAWSSGRTLITLAPRQRIGTCIHGVKTGRRRLCFVFRWQTTVEFVDVHLSIAARR